MARHVQYRPTMNRSTRRRLQLSPETVRVLGGPELRRIVGGNTSSQITETAACPKETEDCETPTFVPTIPPHTVRCK